MSNRRPKIRFLTPADVVGSGRFAFLARIPPVAYGVAVLGLVTLYYVTTQDAFHTLVYDQILLTALSVIALNVLTGTMGLISIGTSAFQMVGAFIVVICLRGSIPFPLDLVVASLVSGVIGFIVGLPAARLRGLFLALSTLALQFIAIFLAEKYQESNSAAATAGFFTPRLFAGRGLAGSYHDEAWVMFGIVSLVVIGTVMVVRQKAGRAMRIIRDHELVAPTFGIRTTAFKIEAFVYTSMLTGFAGGLGAHLTGSITYSAYSVDVSIAVVAAIIIGGMDSVLGSCVGAIVIGALPVYLPKWTAPMLGTQSATSYGPAISQIVYGVLIIVFVVASPGGLGGLLRKLGLRARNRLAQDVPATANARTA